MFGTIESQQLTGTVTNHAVRYKCKKNDQCVKGNVKRLKLTKAKNNVRKQNNCGERVADHFHARRSPLFKICQHEYFTIIFFFIAYLSTVSLTNFLRFSPRFVTSNLESSGVDLSPVKRELFVKYSLAEKKFSQVRSSWSQSEELKRRQLEIVQLPSNFSGTYKPQSLPDFLTLANKVISKHLNIMKPKNSTIAIVSVCFNIDICNISKANHKEYASRHNYDYHLISEHIPGIHPKMVKFLLLVWGLCYGYEWLLMLDADALFTNNDVTIESILDEFQPSKDTSLIITRGGNWRKLHVVNNGVFLLKNSKWSLNHCFHVFLSRWSFTRFLGKTLIDQPVQLSLLLAADELRWPPTNEEERGSHVMVVPKRRMNSYRRDAWFSQQDLAEGSQWQLGDWIVHFASGNKYSLIIDLLEEIGTELPQISARFPFLSKGAAKQDIQSGTCWCKKDSTSHSSTSISCIPRFHVIGVKFGEKTVLGHLRKLPYLLGPYNDDPVQWLTDTISKQFTSFCDQKRNLLSIDSSSTPDATYIREGLRSIRTCSFDDYALLHGNLLTEGNDSSVDHCKDLVTVKKPKQILFDELAIWDSSLSKVRGIPLPEVLKLMQPSAELIISVQQPAQAVYSAYQHSGLIDTSPEYFHTFIHELTSAWSGNNCDPTNYKACLTQRHYSSGSWLASAMYAPFLLSWLSDFDCSQMFIFDLTANEESEVQRLYQFVNKSANKAFATDFPFSSKKHKKESLNKTLAFSSNQHKQVENNKLMMEKTRLHLETFFAPYNMELCSLISTFDCLDIQLFRDLCRDALKRNL